MVTLLGFFFILGNVGLMVIYIPDLVGPVSFSNVFMANPYDEMACFFDYLHTGLGSVMGVL